MNAVDFKARAQYNNLLTAEKEALTRLSKRRDIVIKAADKGGAVMVWSRPLYITKANCQLSNGRYYERLDYDPLKENQNVVKTTITEMIRDSKLPWSAKGLIAPTPHDTTCCPRSTKHATLADQLFRYVVFPPRV